MKGGIISVGQQDTSVFDPTLGGINEFGFFTCSTSKRIASYGIYPPTITIFDFPGLLLLIQIMITAASTKILVFLFQPLNQPKLIAEILAGVLLGPSLLGAIQLPNGLPKVGTIIFPGKSFMIFDGAANLGIVYFMFLVGLSMDPAAVMRAGRKGFLLSTVSLAAPFVIAILAGHLFFKTQSFIEPINVLLALVSSITGGPALMRVLANTKLLHTNVGRLASASAAISDVFSWALFAFFCAVSNKHRHDNILPDTEQPPAPLWAAVVVLIFASLIIGLCFLVVRPIVSWHVRRMPDGETPSPVHLSVVMIGIPAIGMVSDLVGLHPVFGAFVYGLAIPECPLASTIVDSTEGFVYTWLLPLFFAAIGIKTNTNAMVSNENLQKVVIICLASSAVKFGATTLVGLFLSASLSDSLCLGILSISKGMLEIMVLYIGMDRGLLSTEALTMLVLLMAAMATTVTPVVSLFNMLWRQRQVGFKHRNLQKSRPDAELRLLSCVHTSRNVASMIGLLSASNPTKRSPIFVYALHLMELTGRASNMLIVHNTNQKNGQDQHGKPGGGKGQTQAEAIIAAFVNYEQHAGGISVQPITVVSPYATMHEDICTIAGEKHIGIIILPFHKEQAVSSGLEVANSSIRTLNANVIASAPCTVGILVDRGLGATAKFAMGGQQVARHVAVIFLGGPDDREALAYTWRMAENPGISIFLLRLIPGETASSQVISVGSRSSEASVVNMEDDVERRLDDDYVNEFRLKNASNETVVYLEKIVNNSEETVAAVRSMDSIHDLYIVGKGQGRTTPLTEGLEEISECPELGPIGDLVASSDFGRVVSVLVMHHCFEGTSESGAAAAFKRAVAETSKQQKASAFVQRRDRDSADWGFGV